MLARTHGQPASPTRLGKEIEVYVERIDSQLKLLRATPFTCKFGGATGNFNAHHAAYPELDWPRAAPADKPSANANANGASILCACKCLSLTCA